jgi:hypothetical protein
MSKERQMDSKAGVCLAEGDSRKLWRVPIYWFEIVIRRIPKKKSKKDLVL